MKQRFSLLPEAASPLEAAFIFDKKSGLTAAIMRFRHLPALDTYVPTGPAQAVRLLPILLELPAETDYPKTDGLLRRMADWYFSQLKQPPVPPSPGPESAT